MPCPRRRAVGSAESLASWRDEGFRQGMGGRVVHEAKHIVHPRSEGQSEALAMVYRWRRAGAGVGLGIAPNGGPW